MDNGEEIQGLDEEWTLAGAELFEWGAGFVMCMVASELFHLKGGANAPIFMIILIGTTLGMAAMRRKFPDGKRGLRNKCMESMGLPPPGLPAPARIQPRWSGAPLREPETKTFFHKLNLEEALAFRNPEEENPR
jgi:hypothetical protein